MLCVCVAAYNVFYFSFIISTAVFNRIGRNIVRLVSHGDRDNEAWFNMDEKQAETTGKSCC